MGVASKWVWLVSGSGKLASVRHGYFQVYSVNFHPYYRATGGKVVNIQEYFTNYSSVTYPDDIYTRSNVDIVPVREEGGREGGGGGEGGRGEKEWGDRRGGGKRR